MKRTSAAVVIIVVTAASLAGGQERHDYPIVPVPFTEVQVRGGFWQPRLETNRTVTIWYDFEKCEETGRIENFEKAGRLKEGGFRGIYFNDSDVFKIIEGASYSLALHRDPKLDAYLDDLIAKIAAAQEEDGYLYTARTINDPKYDYPGREARWSHLAHGHELYNVGHMYEAAAAHFRATGKRTLLDVAIRNADLVCDLFGPEPGQRVDVPGHEEIEMGLVKLYRITGDGKYLSQARFFIDMRGRSDLRTLYGPYCQDHEPVVEQTKATGHAVRAGYLYAGIADVAALTGDAAYLEAIDRIWTDIVTRKMHLTGGIGATSHGEAFGGDYNLPNGTAYLETCAAIAHALFNHRMFLLHGDAKYIDLLERIIYNGFLSGISLSGDRFFYPNPLACNGRRPFNHGSLTRAPWFGCSCCPVNVVRFIPSIPGTVYAVRDSAVYVNLYIGGTGKIPLRSGQVTLKQETRYPWEGQVRIEIDVKDPTAFTLHLRIPCWARGKPVPGDLYRYDDSSAEPVSIMVNGRETAWTLEKGYALLSRSWKAGDTIELDLPMPVRRVAAHEKVEADEGRTAIERGPIVYCIEGADHDGRVMSIVLPDETKLAAEHRADLLGGVTVLRGKAEEAYRTDEGAAATRSVNLTLIPYHAWCHRGPNEMSVWLPRTIEKAYIPPLPTIATTSRVTVSHRHDDLEALHDCIEPKNSIDHDIPRFTWWDHKGSTEWVQYDFEKPAQVSAAEVYWFDDTGRGRCRVPESWLLLYRDHGQWKRVKEKEAFGVEKDRFNRATFTPVLTDALRLEVKLQPDFSGGILEWKVE